jgi:hypothetical protein
VTHQPSVARRPHVELEARAGVAVATVDSRAAAQRLLGALGLALLLSLGLALGVAALAHADVPDARFCIADTNLVASPDGGFAYTVLLRDNANAPIANGTVVLDFTNAPGIVLCNEQDPDHDGRLIGVTNGAGSVTFYVKAGGQSTGRVRVGTAIDLIALARPRTTDLDGDLDVDSADQAALNALVGTSGPNGDLDRNGSVNSADSAIEAGHVGGNCTFTASNNATWGQLKALYR